MKYLLYVLVVTFINFTASSVGNGSYNLSAVSDEEIAEALYRRVRNENSVIEAPLIEMDQNAKNQICQSITRSDYFSQILKEEWVNLEERCQDIRLKEPDIFRSLYQVQPFADSNPVCINPTIPVNVFVEENKNEVFLDHVFTCLSLDVHDGGETYFVYFVSREYDLRDSLVSPVVKGRFVFGYFNENYDVKVLAVAEEPATTLPLISNTNAHLLYMYANVTRRNSHLRGETSSHSEDNACGLRPLERLRIWTIIMSSAHFKGKLKFVPTFEYVDPYRCTKMEVIDTMIDQGIIIPSDSDPRFMEWVIGCRVTPNFGTNFHSEYFLSRISLLNDDVYVYRRGIQHPDKVVVENLFHEVRFKI